MSFNTYAVRGYGVATSKLDSITDVSRIWKLLDKAPVFKKEVEEYFESYLSEGEKPTATDFLMYDESDFFGAANILKAVIQEAEDIELEVCVDDYYGPHLLFISGYPWSKYTDAEKSLTEEGLRKIISKYVSILTDEQIQICEHTIRQEG